MDRLDRFILLAEDGQVDPGEVWPESRAPDDVRRLEDAVVFEQRQSIPRAHNPRDAFDVGGGDVFRLDADERRTMGEELRAHPAADRRAHCQDSVADEPEHQRQEDEPGRCALDAEGDVTGLLPGEPGRVALDHLDRDLGARVPDSDDEHRSCAKLRRVPVLARMELDDARVELVHEGRHPGNLLASHRHDHVLCLEAPVARLDHGTRRPFFDSRSTLTPVRTGSSNRDA